MKLIPILAMLPLVVIAVFTLVCLVLSAMAGEVGALMVLGTIVGVAAAISFIWGGHALGWG